MIDYLPPPMPEYFSSLARIYPDDIKGKTITLQVTEDCCMACTYCYQNCKTNNKMSFKIAKDIIDKILNDELDFVNTKNTTAVAIDFIGGEPLMEVELIDKIINYTLTKMIEMQHPWLYFTRFSICSNGLLYNTDKVQDFFRKYNSFISFGVSVDGNKYLHDLCRLDLNGNGTYERVIKNVKKHYKNYGILPGTKMTLSPENVIYTKDALINLIEEGYSIIPFNCVFEKGWTTEHASILYKELKNIGDYLIDNDLYNKINIRMFEERYFCPMPESDDRNWCGGVNMNMIAFDYKGDIFPCIRYMQSSLNNRQKPIKVGNIYSGELTNEEERNNLELISNITRRSQSTDKCFNCPIATGCSWCSGYNYEEFGTPNKRATYICEMHQAQALANVYYWNKLYQYLNINKVFPCNVPKDWALQIINEDEYNYLQEVSRGRKDDI